MVNVELVICDMDMVVEMSDFMKNQILFVLGTVMVV